MQDEHRDIIQKNFSSLVEQTELDMVSALYEKGVFSEQMIERYRDPNKDARTIKRQLYMDIMRRGPHAFGHLINCLTELGYWSLARDLDPNSRLHPTSSKDFVSISAEKKKSRFENQKTSPPAPPRAVSPPAPPAPQEDFDDTPKFNVIKSTKFMEPTDKDMKLYAARSRRRGMLLVFSYMDFQNFDSFRAGVDVDCCHLKYLFSEMGFHVLSYSNLTKKETVDALESLTKEKSFSGYDCVFTVFSSHGYERFGSSDTDIRCSDGNLISTYSVLKYFSNVESPHLRGIPKVFIFQLCRGDNREHAWALRPRRDPPHMPIPTSPAPAPALPPAPATDGSPCPAGAAPRPPPRAAGDSDHTRLSAYTDILIAHSTLPGFVSFRDEAAGSWYIQALCEVFAARAHDCDVRKLFTLVNVRLQDRFHIQTSSVDNWGFNWELYLHPGLYEDDAAHKNRSAQKDDESNDNNGLIEDYPDLRRLDLNENESGDDR